MNTLSTTTITVAAALTFSLSSQAETNAPYGVEALTTYRSEYTHRGFKLSNDSLEFQLSSQISIDDSTSINLAAWYNTGDNDFSEIGLFANISKDIDDFTYAMSVTYRGYSNSIFEDGVDIAGSLTWHANDSWDLGTTISYDTGAEGWYADLNASYYYRIDDSSYLTIKGGVSGVSDYYGRDGLNDIFTKISYTYNINESVSVSPFLGTSILLNNDDNDGNSLFGGINFAVSF